MGAKPKIINSKYVELNPENGDDWTCLCGNKTGTDGFQPCNSEGTLVEPTADADWDNLFKCMACGQVIDPHERQPLEMVKKEPYYFTFGSGQEHEGCFTVIHAYSRSQARCKMFEQYGAKWSMQYDKGFWFNSNGVSQQQQFKLVEI